MDKQLQKYFVLTIFITLAFFIISIIFQTLHLRYFEKHQAELASGETIILPDNSEVTNYIYADTPYTLPATIFFFAYLIIPAIVVMSLSARYFLSKKKYGASLFIPLVFVILTFLLLQFYNVYHDLGWDERNLGLMLTIAYTGTVFLLTVIINGVLAKIKKK